jgi:electron transfer flavoprotein beta subunit
MNIVVLVKQVPAISDIKIDVKDNNLVRVGAPSMMNPVDMHAIEAAVAVKDAVGDANITIMTMGTALAGEIMREGIALGINQGVLISDERMAGSDTLATGTILAKAIESIGGADLVFTGKRSTDGDTGQIPPALAQNLGMSLLSYAESLKSMVRRHVLPVRIMMGWKR